MPSPTERASWRAPLLALAVVALVAAGLVAHVSFLNGPWYWKWPWRRLETLRVLVALGIALAPFAAALWAFRRRRGGLFAPLCGLAAAALCLQIAGTGLHGERFELGRIWRVVVHDAATSYFGDAIRLRDEPDLLRSFPQRMPGLGLHSRNKPPGAILFHRTMIRLFGPNVAAALAGGLVIGLLAALAPVATFWLARALGGGRERSFHAAALVTLCPGHWLFFPQLDQVYPLFTCAILGGWAHALRTQRPAWAVFSALALATVSFVAYNLLVLGAWLAGYAAYRIAAAAPEERGPATSQTARALALAAAVVAAGYGLLHLQSGFDPLATFRTALANQARLAAMLGRPWAASLLFDPLDFALGLGWLPLVAAGLGLASARRAGLDHEFWVCLLCLAQVATVAASGLLRTETARVWIFLFPLVAYPASREIARWTPAQQNLAYAALALFGAVVVQNLVFLDVV